MTSRDVSLLQRFLDANRRLSAKFDGVLPADARVDGMMYFLDNEVPRLLRDGDLVADLGSGKMPAVAKALKIEKKLKVIGVDIDPAELARAPAGSYDSTIVADLTRWRGEPIADVAICSAVMEHVTDTAAVLDAMASVLRPGGRAIVFCPCRNAVFARLNLLLPQHIKLRLLDVLYGGGHGVGFPAYYKDCTPGQFEAMAANSGLRVEKLQTFYMSAYFDILAPVHIAWRAYQGAARAISGRQACESFILVAVKD